MRADDLEKTIDETPNGHSQLVYLRKASSVKGLDHRDFLARVIWKSMPAGGFIRITTPEESANRQPLPGVVRGKYPSTMRIKPLNDKFVELEYVIQIDFGGIVPAWITNSYIRANLSYITEIQEYFESRRRLEQWDADDGITVGELMLVRTKAEGFRKNGVTKVAARMQDIFSKYEGLKEIGKKYSFFQAMMTLVVENKLRPPGDVSQALINLSMKQGATIGAGMAVSLASNLTAEAAVEEWIGKYPALRELDEKEVWFRPMINIVALRLLGEVAWGLKMRVFLGAGLSIMDTVSDINVIVLYSITRGQEGYGTVLLGMIVASMLFQLLIVYLQSRARPWEAATEALFVVTGLKPGRFTRKRLGLFSADLSRPISFLNTLTLISRAGVDAYRVASGAEMKGHQVIDPTTALVFTKVIEMFAESIPGETCARQPPLLVNPC
jgi:hypothetical protein